jgi:hypothetical protein
MKIAYLLCLIGCIVSYGPYFWDISYNTLYEVEMSKFYPLDYMPGGTSYYFRVAVEQDDKMQIQLTVQKGAIINFKVDVCGFYGRPSDTQVITGHDNCRNALTGKYDGTEYDRDVYKYDFETITGINYLAIHIQTTDSLYYLSVYIYSAKGTAIALILILIFLPCIIIAAIVIFCLRRCGIITIGGGVSSNKI